MTTRVLAGMAVLMLLVLAMGCRSVVDPEAQAALDAGSRYVRATSQVGTFKVQVDRMDGIYARLHVWPNADESSPPLLLYMKKVDERWQPLVMASRFEPGELEGFGVPASLDPDRRS